MSFYKPVNESYANGSQNYNYIRGGYKTNKENLDGDREDLFDVWFEELKKRRILTKVQLDLLDAYFNHGVKYNFWRIGRKGTKTTLIIFIAWGESLKGKNRTTHIFLPTLELAKEVYWDENRLQYCDLCDPEDKALHNMFIKHVDKQRHLITFVNGSTVKLGGTWSEARGRGTQPNLLMFDEAKDCKAEFLSAAEPNLAAKEDSRCILAGTPPKKKNHYHEWEDRVIRNPQGKRVHYTSYSNTALPHLKEWLDNKRDELIAAGKEDEWLREYMAEDCFSSDERVLPDAQLTDHNEIMSYLRSVDSTAFTPIIGITITSNYLCSVIGVMLHSRYTGVQTWILNTHTEKRLWDKSYKDMYHEIEKQMKVYSDTFPKPWRKVVYDQTESFTDIISGITESRKDIKWTNRGVPLLKEMMINGKSNFSTQADQFGVESQNLLKEDNILDYPTVCTMAMLANEYYQPPSLSKDEQVVWDEFAPLREAGIICTPPRKRGKEWVSFNWN